MTKHIYIILSLLTLLSCGQNEIKMNTPENANDKFQEFISKKKFIEEPYPNSYPGIADEKMRPVFTDKINLAAKDFLEVAKSNNPTDKAYQDKIKIGLYRFADVYLDLDTEDRERVCFYFEELMNIVELESSDGHLNNFMYGFDPNEVIEKNK